jgi:cysteinyl-tRNA synthetase
MVVDGLSVDNMLDEQTKQRLMTELDQARKEKDYQKSDEIRQQIIDLGYKVMIDRDEIWIEVDLTRIILSVDNTK